MASKELVDYVKKVREQGHSHENIKKHLLNHGYDENDIDEVLGHGKDGSKKPLVKINIKIPLLTLVGVFLVFIAYQWLIISSIPEECNDISVSIHKINEQEALCVFPDGSRVQMILKNDGQKLITSLNIEIDGSKGDVSKELKNINLVPGNVSTSNIDFTGNGDVKKITVVPTILSGEEISCSTKGIRARNIKTC